MFVACTRRCNKTVYTKQRDKEGIANYHTFSLLQNSHMQLLLVCALVVLVIGVLAFVVSRARYRSRYMGCKKCGKDNSLKQCSKCKVKLSPHASKSHTSAHARIGIRAVGRICLHATGGILLFQGMPSCRLEIS